MGVDVQGFPGGLLRLDPAFAYVEPPSSWPLPWAECLTPAPNTSPVLFWACALEPQLLSSCAIITKACMLWSRTLKLLKARAPRAHVLQQEKPPQWEAHAPQQRTVAAHRSQRKSTCSREDLVQLKNNDVHKRWEYKGKRKRAKDVHKRWEYKGKRKRAED